MNKITPEMRRILNDLDVDASLRHSATLYGWQPTSTSDADKRIIALAGMHKARIQAGRVFSHQQRKESAIWLREHGFKIPLRSPERNI